MMDTVFVDTILEVSVLLGLAAGVAFALRDHAAALRHFTWTTALVGCLALPAFSALGPDVVLRVPVPSLFRWVEGSAHGQDLPVPHTAEPIASGGTYAGGWGVPSATAGGASSVTDGPAAADHRRSDAPATLVGDRTAAIRGLPAGLPATAGLLGIWLLGVALVLGTVLVGRARLWWLARGAVRVDGGPVWMAANRLALRLRLRRLPIILEGPDHAVPMTWGVRRPVVLLPPGAASWPRWRLDAVLLHELGHVARRDYAAQLIAQLACALYWFHPLVWHAASRMRLEREHACDDLVVRSGHEPAAYAGDLVELARHLGGSRLDAAALAIARRGQLESRLRAILDPSRDRSGLNRRTGVLAGVATLALSFTVSAVTAEAAEPGTRAAAERAATPADTPLDPPTFTLLAPRRPSPDGLEAVDVERVPLPIVTGPPLVDPTVQEAQVLCGPADGESRQQLHMRNNERRTVIRSYGDCTSSIEIDGELGFSRDFTTVMRVEPGGQARIEVTRGGVSRRVILRSGVGQRPEYEYRVDGDDRPFDDRAAEWLAHAWQDFFRSSNYMADERAAWFLSQGGPQALLQESDRMLSDHARATYLTVLLEQPGLRSDMVRTVIERAGATIESDHSLGELLAAAARHQSFDASARTAFLEAARSIDSDHTQSEVFATALSQGDLSDEDLVLLLETAAASIDSDHTLGELLIGLAERYELEPRLREPFLAAAATIDSDHTAGEVYSAVLQRPDLAAGEVAAVLEAAGSIDSDHTLSELLIDVVGPRLEGSTLRTAWLRAARTIGSDHSQGKALMAFLRVGDLGPAAQVDVLRTASGLGSDHQLAELLVEFTRLYRVQGEVEAAFRQTLQEVGSRHQRSRVEEALRRG